MLVLQGNNELNFCFLALGSTPYITSNLSAIKPRAKTITATRPKGTLTGRSGMVIPVGAQQIPQSAQNIQIKSVSKPPIHIKQEGGKEDSLWPLCLTLNG